MKALLIFLSFLICLNALALSRGELDQLLLEKGTSIAAFEARGLKLIMGERTGGGRNFQFASIEVIFTQDEAFLKKEIQNTDISSFQAAGRQIHADEIIAVITR